VTTYADIVRALAAIESFDEKAFVGDDQYPQDLCDLILALALVYNDFKDVFMGHAILGSSAPPGPAIETQPWGNHNGIRVHLTRVQCALIHELLELLRRSGEVIHSAAFKRVLHSLPKSEREAWVSLEDAVFHRASNRVLAKALHTIRNNVAYHYDSAEIAAGFRAACGDGPAGEPRLSRGNDLSGTRFYFADAAAQSAYLGVSGETIASSFLKGDLSLLSHIHHALFHLVTSFIQHRGFAWRQPKRRV
jgi:hypothetical protein